MKKKFIYLAMAILSALPAWAETPEEVYRKHPDKQSYFFKTPNEDKDGIKNFDIERITFDNDNDVVIFKTIQSDREIVKEIKRSLTDVEGFDGVLFFNDESGIGMTPYFMVLYRSTTGGTMWMQMDIGKQLEFQNLKKD